MAILDKNYLSLQFKYKVYQKSASEYQSFFEEIMGKAFQNFQKIRPYGKYGDQGNDGYRPDEGIYYQIYSPKNPEEKETVAAEKFKNDFELLKNSWDEISKIKSYIFVFNDKYAGVSIELEKVKSKLKLDNPTVEFDILFPKQLEEIFFTLKEEDISSLGFDIDSRNALRISREYLEKLDIELDRGNAEYVFKTIQNIKDIITDQNDENLVLDYEILEARTLQRLEFAEEASNKFANIFRRYPNDPRAPLYLAEIYLTIDDFEKNDELLKKAEQIDNKYWLLRLEKLIREYRLGKKISISEIDEQTFPEDRRKKADLYRIYSLFLQESGDHTSAESFIERAIYLNPDKFFAYDTKLSFLQEKIILQRREETETHHYNDFVAEIEKVQQKFAQLNGLGPRNRIYLGMKKHFVFLSSENYKRVGDIAKEIFELALKCYFDTNIDRILIEVLRSVKLPGDDFGKLLNYIQKADKKISPNLAKYLVLQFLGQNRLFSDGKEYFKEIGSKADLEFINSLENQNYDHALSYLIENKVFAVNFAVIAKTFPDLRRKVIEALPDDGSINKDILFLLFNYEEGDVDKAFEILRSLDVSNLRYADCRPTLKVAEEKEAWELVIILLEKLLQYERENYEILKIKLKLFTANLKLERFPEVIRLGEEILFNSTEETLLDDYNKELLVRQTVYSYMRRGKYPEAKRLVANNANVLKTFEAKVMAADVYLKNSDPNNALISVVDAVKTLRRPSSEEYGSLFLIFSQIGNLMDFPLASLDKVDMNTFVKFKDQEKWFYIGDGDELDAININKANQAKILNKKLGENISFGGIYRSEQSEHEIENILPLDKYILWQSVHNAQKLSVEGVWDIMEAIQVPTTEEGINTEYLIARLEDENKRGQEFFDIYCKQNVPLALLALSEGGLTNTIGRIVNERRGFIKANSGSQPEMEQQKNIARKIISGEPFYIDGTSALFLSETGLLEKIYIFLPNIKVPQSVISLLLEVKDRFRSMPGQVGYISYSGGKIHISAMDSAKWATIKDQYEKSIHILESESRSVDAISLANKSESLSEQKVPPSLCDACILAQRDSIPILTEDFLYLQINEKQTGKKAPEYCSTFAIIKVLYEQKKISFDEYLNFFSYLSSYRVWFLPITLEDIENALFGDGIVKVIKPDELVKFNFPLTLSEEYGVPPQTAFNLVGHFIIKLIIDDSVLPLIVEQIYRDIVSTFPTTQDKKLFGKALLVFCDQELKKIRGKIIIGTMVQEKMELLSLSIQGFSSSGPIIL